MKLQDKIIIKEGSKEVAQVYILGEIFTHYLVSENKNSLETTPINKKHNYIKLDENTYEIDILPIAQHEL